VGGETSACSLGGSLTRRSRAGFGVDIGVIERLPQRGQGLLDAAAGVVGAVHRLNGLGDLGRRQ